MGVGVSDGDFCANKFCASVSTCEKSALDSAKWNVFGSKSGSVSGFGFSLGLVPSVLGVGKSHSGVLPVLVVVVVGVVVVVVGLVVNDCIGVDGNGVRERL